MLLIRRDDIYKKRWVFSSSLATQKPTQLLNTNNNGIKVHNKNLKYFSFVFVYVRTFSQSVIHSIASDQPTRNQSTFFSYASYDPNTKSNCPSTFPLVRTLSKRWPHRRARQDYSSTHLKRSPWKTVVVGRQNGYGYMSMRNIHFLLRVSPCLLLYYK